MDPTMYAPIKLSHFNIAPPDPVNILIYPVFATPQVLKTVERLWDNLQNYYLSYITITRACFRLLDENIPDQFKVSNDPTLVGGNLTMNIQLMLTQLETLFGKPSNALMGNNNKLFRLNFNPNDAPELLFLQVEQCQEVAIIAQNPYSDM